MHSPLSFFFFLQVAGVSVFARPSPIECTDGGCAVPGWEDVAMRTSTRVIPLGWKWTRHRRHKKRKTDGACLFTAPNTSRIIWLREDGVSRTFQRGLMIPVHRHYWGHADLCPRRRSDLAPIHKRRYPSHLIWQTHFWDENWTVTDWTLTKSVPVCFFLFFLKKKKRASNFSWALIPADYAWACASRPKLSLKCLRFLFLCLQQHDDAVESELSIKDYGYHRFIERKP